MFRFNKGYTGSQRIFNLITLLFCKLKFLNAEPRFATIQRF